MSKLFGEYLVDKGLISEDQLLDALIAQIEEQSSVVKIVRDLDLIKKTDILKVLKQQVKDQTSFLETASKMSLWNADKNLKLFEFMSTERTPLGEILVGKKYLDIGKLTSALDDFFGEKLKVPEPSVATDPTIPKSSAALSGPYSEIFEQFGPQFFETLNQAVNSVAEGRISDSQIWKSLSDELHKIQSAAKLYDFPEMAEFAEKSENIIRELLARKPDALYEDVVRKMHSAFADSKKVLEKALNEQKSQILKSNFFSSEANSKMVKSIYDWYSLIEFDISHIEKEKGE